MASTFRVGDPVATFFAMFEDTTTPVLGLETDSTAADINIESHRRTNSAVASQNLATDYVMKNSSGTQIQYGRTRVESTDNEASAEDAKYVLQLLRGGR